MIRERNIDESLCRIYRDILKNGEMRTKERTGIGTRATFFQTLQFDASKYAPISQTRPIAAKHAIVELIWIIRGLTNIQWLEEHGCKYWKHWADKNGELGKVYGYQMRNFESKNHTYDQLKELIDGLKNNPEGRRHIISLWNPANLSEQKLPCCHLYSQFFLRENKSLDILVMQRSCDFLLGVPHDLVIYKGLLDLVAREIGAKPGIINYVFADAHLYLNHLDAAEELCRRVEADEIPLTQPKLIIDSDKDIFNIEPEEIKIEQYNPLPKLDPSQYNLTVAV